MVNTGLLPRTIGQDGGIAVGLRSRNVTVPDPGTVFCSSAEASQSSTTTSNSDDVA